VESNGRRKGSPQDNELDSAVCVGEPAREWRSPNPSRDAVLACTIATQDTRRYRMHEVVGDGMPGRFDTSRRDTCGISEDVAGVRVVIVAKKPGNAGGAKDDRKMDTQ